MAASKGQIKDIKVIYNDCISSDHYCDSDFQVIEGHLHIIGKLLGNDRCVYAPGHWAKVDVSWRDR